MHGRGGDGADRRTCAPSRAASAVRDSVLQRIGQWLRISGSNTVQKCLVDRSVSAAQLPEFEADRTTGVHTQSPWRSAGLCAAGPEAARWSNGLLGESQSIRWDIFKKSAVQTLRGAGSADIGARNPKWARREGGHELEATAEVAGSATVGPGTGTTADLDAATRLVE